MKNINVFTPTSRINRCLQNVNHAVANCIQTMKQQQDPDYCFKKLALGKNSIKFSKNSLQYLAVVCDIICADLLRNGIASADEKKDRTITTKHVFNNNLENLVTWPLFNNLPIYRQLVEEMRTREIQKKIDRATKSLMMRNKRLSKSMEKPAEAPAEAPAESPAESPPQKVTLEVFAHSCHLIFTDININKYKIKFDVKQVLSNVIEQFIYRVGRSCKFIGYTKIVKVKFLEKLMAQYYADYTEFVPEYIEFHKTDMLITYKSRKKNNEEPNKFDIIPIEGYQYEAVVKHAEHPLTIYEQFQQSVYAKLNTISTQETNGEN